MSKTICSVDLDGVVFGGDYVPAWDRHPETYLSLPLLDGAREAVNRLLETHHVYFLSSRCFEDALAITRQALWSNGIHLPRAAGTIVGVPPSDKLCVSRLIGSQLHIDDCPGVFNAFGGLRPKWTVHFVNPSWGFVGKVCSTHSVGDWGEAERVVGEVLK